MFTSVDKALVAIVMAVAYLLSNIFGVDVPEGQIDIVEALIVAATPLLVYFFPNRTT